ncbi:MAG: hypothetical protein P8L85_01030 [Rubripirellula sp.]|nr:hypothetical protein [Rubripirellula sp.]
MTSPSRLLACFLLVQFVSSPAPASAQYGDYERAPINYSNAEVNDAVAHLVDKMATGEVSLNYEPGYGYLRSVLEALDVPISSQTLVFSRTSLQLQRISPRRPRALYFSDDVYIGFCQQGDVLEIAATDATQGATFYVMEQDQQGSPTFLRDKGVCLSCHASSRTQNVPGYLVRSVFTDVSGRPRFGSGTFLTDQTSNFHDRWGGWYVTGQHGAMRHMGNTICRGDEHTFDREPGANHKELSKYFSVDDYLSPHSDIVALMVLEHQTQMHNAIAAANYETRLALYQCREMNKLLERPDDYRSDSTKRRIASSVDRVLRYLLMCDEFTLTDQVVGTSEFTSDFTARGKQDTAGRSLREFNLETRLFEYPCSYLIHAPAFTKLPDEVRRPILGRLNDILSGKDTAPEFNHLSPAMRQDITEILRDTMPEFKQLSQNH